MLRIEYENKIVSGKEFPRFVRIIAEGLEIPDLDETTLVDSVRHLAGIPLTAETIEIACHRLAGNVPRLKSRRPIVAWQLQRHPEWVPVQVMGAKTALNNSGRNVGVLLTMKIMAGAPCPITVLHWWSYPQCRQLARLLGFSRGISRKTGKSGRYPYTSPFQLVGMRLDALVDPELSERDPVFSRFRCPAVALGWNKLKLKQRFRIDPGFTCPENYTTETPCHLCSRGYDTCAGATHRQQYVIRNCPRCKQDTHHDLDMHTPYCVTCATEVVYDQVRKPKG